MTIWSRWAGWLVLAIILTGMVAYYPVLPGELAGVGAWKALAPAGGLWGAFNDFVAARWLFATVVLGITILLYFVLPPRESIVPLAGLMGGMLIEWIVKPIADRPRPPGTDLDPPSYPSGQALWLACWLGALAIVLARHIRGKVARRVVVGILVAIAALGGIARLAVGAHWTSDVLGAWLFSATWVLWLARATRASNTT